MSGTGAMRGSGATLAICLAVAIILARVAALPLMPIDETRYLSVAWEMWQHQVILVPLINGEAYSHKPPLLLWLLQLGWWLFGTSDGVARLVIPAMGLAGFWLVADIVRQLAPDARREAWWAPLRDPAPAALRPLGDPAAAAAEPDQRQAGPLPPGARHRGEP